jgi:hypothetical protein
MFFNTKRIISSFVLLALLVFPTFVKADENEEFSYINYYGIEMNYDEYSTLKELGFNENEIYHMDMETFNANKDLEATLLAREDKYFKTVYPTYGNAYTVEVTEEEYNNSDNNKLSLRGEQTTPYKHIVTTISANSNKYRYKISVTWRQIPSVKKYDIIGIGYEDLVHIYNSVIYFGYFYSTSGSDYSSTMCFDQKVTDYGATTVYKIPEGITLTGLASTLYYDVVKDAGVGTLTSLWMCGDYAHATSTSVTSSLAAQHSISYGGIGLGSNNISLYDAIPCTYANASVNW